jgi:O-antigen ligase
VLQNISDKPLLGWGIGVSRSLPGSQEKIAELNRELLPLHPHNSIFEVWVELGLVGALALTVLIFFIMIRIVRIVKEQAATAVLFGSASAYIVIGLTSYSIWSSWWIATAILSTGIWTALLAERKTPPVIK